MKVNGYVAAAFVCFVYVVGFVAGILVQRRHEPAITYHPPSHVVNTGAYKVDGGWMFVIEGKAMLKVDCKTDTVVPQ